ncbi:MAG: TRAP transporter substrate-binding protein DctP [Terriglobia bacterium]
MKMSAANEFKDRALWTLGLVLGLVSVGADVTALRGAAPPVRIKLATIIPRGTPPYEALLEMREKWRQAPDGGVELIVYPDGTMGGEADMVRRMRVGQIQAALLSMTGLSEIDKSVNALQDMPMMFRSLDEVEYVREKMRPTLEKRLADRGFVALFWGDIGWVRFFSKDAAVRPSEFMRMKLFAWAGDNEQLELMKRMGFNVVPLETNDILPGLQTGLINAVPTAPLYALAGQFNGPCPHMLDLNYAPLGGAVVINKKTWDTISPATQQALLKAAAEAGIDVTKRSRVESDQAVEAMQKRGLTVHHATSEIEAEWRTLAEGVYPKIRGGMVPADVFDEVERLLQEYRTSPAAGQRGGGGKAK